MTGSATQGYAARLLDRAAGRAGGLRPRIASYFGAKAATPDPLIEERRIEHSAPPPAPQDRTEDTSVQATDGQTERTTTSPRPPETEPPISAPRLMPPVAPDPQDQPRQPTAAAAPQPETHPRAAPEAGATRSDPPPEMTSPELPFAPEGNQPVRDGATPPDTDRPPTVSVPDLQSALAAAVARLTPSPEKDREPGLMPRAEPERPVTATPPPGAPEAPALQSDDSIEAPAPLHIHIGEIVIAPDPQAPPASKAASAPQPPAWQPTLSLDDYREQRRKEGA